MSLWEKPGDRESDSQVIQRMLNPGDCFIDVGANIGHLTIEAALRVGQRGAVYAFEAHPRTCSFLRENIALNRLTNVRVANAAVGEFPGWVRFEDRSSDDQNAVSLSGEIWVPAVSLDALCGDVHPTLLKIDVEGFELPVLKGAVWLLSRTRFIYFEAWEQHFSKYGYRFSDLWEFLKEAGFSLVREDASGGFVEIPRDYECSQCINLLAIKNAGSQTLAPERL